MRRYRLEEYTQYDKRNDEIKIVRLRRVPITARRTLASCLTATSRWFLEAVAPVMAAAAPALR